jgi:two-component system NtrC family sensor kinase
MTHQEPNGSPPPVKGRFRSKLRGAYDCVGWRLVTILVACLFLLLGASGVFMLELHRDQLRSLLEENAMGMGETILSSTYLSMLRNDREHLARTIDNIGSRESVITLRLLDAKGEVRYSNRSEEVGSHSDLDAPLCQGCHRAGTARAPQTIRDGFQLYALPSGERALGLGVPVLNAPECSSADCHVHPSGQRVLGMLDLELSTLPLQRAMRTARWQTALFALITVTVISLVVGFVVWRVVHRPVHALLAGTRRLGSGDLSFRVTEAASGEIAELADSFNKMSERLEQARTELENWGRTLEAKVEEKTRELERTRDQMVFAEKMASLGKLAAIVAHEINNPLAGILVYTKLVRRKLTKLKPEGKPEDGLGELDETLATMEAETARCGDIVRNLLLFSRRRESERGPCELNEILERTVKLVQHQADLAGVRTKLDLGTDIPTATCDAAQIQQAMLAMVMNGIEAMPDGGDLTVRTRYRTEPREVVVEVQDTGIGIPDEVRQKIFEPFFSTKHEGKGTGLGLSVLYGIIQEHEGRIDVDSTPGKGTTFRINLPLEPKVDSASGASPTGIREG